MKLNIHNINLIFAASFFWHILSSNCPGGLQDDLCGAGGGEACQKLTTSNRDKTNTASGVLTDFPH